MEEFETKMMLAVEVGLFWCMVGGDILGAMYVGEWLLEKWRTRE